jgi:hypothetical protein
MKARDIAGIVIGVPVFLLGLYVGLGALHLGLYFGLVSATLLFVSVGLFIPSRRYEHGIARAIGFVALSLATALTVGCVAGFGLNLHDSFHEVAGDDATALLAIAVGCLMAFVFSCLGTWVLQMKLNPRPAHSILAAVLGAVSFVVWR